MLATEDLDGAADVEAAGREDVASDAEALGFVSADCTLDGELVAEADADAEADAEAEAEADAEEAGFETPAACA